MRHLTILAVVLVAAVLAAPFATAAAADAKKRHDVNNVTVVSTDEKNKTITFVTDTGDQKTSPVLGEAINKLRSVKAGDKVTLVCSDKANGEHEAVTDIKMTAGGDKNEKS